MAIKVICVGKIRKAFAKDGVEEYAKRLSKYCKFEYKEVKDNSQLEKNVNDEKEGVIVALDVKGEKISSEKFAETLKKLNLENKNIRFVIGGFDGLTEKVLKKSDLKISLSKMTFPNELVRVIFLEQLYRAFTIMKNEKYHK